MNRNFVKYISFLLIGLLVSCADDSVHNYGKIEFQVKENFVTPTNAIVEVSIPHPEINSLTEVISICLVKDGFNSYEDFYDAWESNSLNCVEGRDLIYRDDAQYKDKCIYGFNDLIPGTIYYIVAICKVKSDFDDKSGSVIYYTGYSFTTKSEGDYSGLGKALCGYSNVQRDKIRLEVVLPDYLESYNRMTLYASEYKDMQKPISQTEYGLSFEFPTFPKKTFYFRLKGDFKIYLDENLFFVYTDETIDFENSIDFLLLYESLGY